MSFALQPRDALLITKRVANSPARVNELGLEAPIYLTAQSADEHVYHIGLRIKVTAPHVLHDHVFRTDSAGFAHEVFQKRKFARLKIDLLA